MKVKLWELLDSDSKEAVKKAFGAAPKIRQRYTKPVQVQVQQVERSAFVERKALSPKPYHKARVRWEQPHTREDFVTPEVTKK